MPRQKTPKYYPPTAENFMMVRRLSCLSRKNASEMLHVSLKTIINWETGKTSIPYASYKLLRILSGYELPGDAWQGWSIRDNKLFNPTGRCYQSHELYYIANMIQMARYWLSERQNLRQIQSKPNHHKQSPLYLIHGGLK